jgi:hypothetical protein
MILHPLGGQPPAGLSTAWELATLRAYLVFLSYYQLVMLFLNMVCLTVALACDVIYSHVTCDASDLQTTFRRHFVTFASFPIVALARDGI